MNKKLLSSFGDDSKAIVIGASGGIGQGFVNHLKVADNFSEVIPLSRSQDGFDMVDEESIKLFADKIENQSIDLIIIATGYLGLEPEKSLKDLSMDKFQQVFAANIFGPALVMKHFAPKLKRESKSVMVSLSARVGSIGDNNLGGWYAYRASKSALNMIIRNTSIEIGRINKQAVIAGLHPGTVDTDLSKPFQGHVPSGKLFTPEFATQSMLETIDNLGQGDTGYIFAYDGQKIEF